MFDRYPSVISAPVMAENSQLKFPQSVVVGFSI